MNASTFLLLILDGISDRPCPQLAGLTPLQAARTPVLDELARGGICGIMDPISPGIRPGSDTAHLSLLGYPPERYYTGRGPLEAEGSGIHMLPGMVGFRANFATVDGRGIVTDRRAGRIQDTRELSASISDQVDLSSFDVEFLFASGAGHRGAFALNGGGLGHRVSSNDPKTEGKEVPDLQALSSDPSDGKTAEICNEFVRQSREILSAHPVNLERVESGLPPANFVLLRGAGEMGRFEPFEKRYGLKGSVIAAATLIQGIGRAIGLKIIAIEGITGSVNTDLRAKIAAACRELQTRDFVLLNIKGADEAGHDGDAVAKRDFIEKIDAALSPLLDLEDCLIVACGDHSTPCQIRDHSADPVPLVIRGIGVRVDSVEKFDEFSCSAGGMHRICGGSLMPVALDLMNKTHKYGA